MTALALWRSREVETSLRCGSGCFAARFSDCIWARQELEMLGTCERSSLR